MERIKTKDDLQMALGDVGDIVTDIGAFVGKNGSTTDFSIALKQIRIIGEKMATLIAVAENVIDQNEKEERKS